MISLKVAEFCHNCPEFEADVERNIFRVDGLFDDPQFSVSTEVSCIHRHRCRSMMNYLKTNDSKGEKENA